MWQCEDVEARLTPYVDGELPGDERAAVDRHLGGCPRCRTAVEEERAGALAVTRRAAALRATHAPAALQARCAEIASGGRLAADAKRVRVWLVQSAAAAALLLAAGAYLVHLATEQSTTVLAAQLTADHIKCFLTSHDEVAEAETVAASLRLDYGFDARVPPGQMALGLNLVGARRCLSGEGTNAHLLYTWRGESVSLYMLPDDETRLTESLHVLGHDTRVWSAHNGTYVLVTPTAEDATVAPLVEYFRGATE